MNRSYLAIAASIAADKRMSPELFCGAPRCLWRTRTAEGHKPCPKHTPPTLQQKLEKSVALSADDMWKGVTINTPVVFDGEMTTWGELAQNEKMMCSWNSNGVLEGAFPF